ncbi:MAG: DUF4412 domain-containing protein [Candidatus Korobacteraceae bacterium]
MKLRIPAVAVVILTFLLLLPWAVAQQLTPFSADIQFTSNRNPNTPHEMNGKMYVDSGHMRMEMQGGPRGETVMINNFATHTADMVLVEQKMYMEYNTEQRRMRGPGMPDIHPYRDPSNPCGQEAGLTCKKVGVEQVNGRTCDHWQMTDKSGKVTNVWIDQQLHFPIKNVSEDGTWQLTNVREGEPEASLFQVPAGYQRMDMGRPMVNVKPAQQ